MPFQLVLKDAWCTWALKSPEPNIGSRRDELLEGIRRQLLPVLEDVLELGLGFEPGKLHQALQMTTAIVHYYPDTTKKDTAVSYTYIYIHINILLFYDLHDHS